MGRITLSRNSVRPRSRRLSRLATNSAMVSCGTVDSTNMPNVFHSAFQNTVSVTSRW